MSCLNLPAKAVADMCTAQQGLGGESPTNRSVHQPAANGSVATFSLVGPWTGVLPQISAASCWLGGMTRRLIELTFVPGVVSVPPSVKIG